MADNNETFKISLDAKEFLESALRAKGSIESIGDSENLAGLMEGLLKASAAIAAVGVAAFALKATFDLVFEAEQIKRTNNLFDEMSKSIGVVGERFKEDLVGAAKGLADDTDILQAASKAITMMGESAKRLPEVMELARKITMNFGGDLVERFQQINYAIASGSTKMLRANGIIIDADKAIKDYAKSLGVSADSLTAAGRQQAVMNATLEFGRKKIKEIKGAQEDALTTSQQLSVTVKEIGEAFVLAFEKFAGPAVRVVLRDLKDIASVLKNQILASFGEGAESTAAKVNILHGRLEYLNKELAKLEEQSQRSKGNGGGWLEWIFGGPDYDRRIEKVKKDIESVNAELAKSEAVRTEEKKKSEAEGAAAAKNASTEELVNYKKVHEERLKFESEILRMKQENARHNIEMAQNEHELEQAEEEMRITLAQERYNKLLELQQKYQSDSNMTHAQYLEMQRQIDEEFLNSLQKMEMEHDANRQRMDDNYLRHSQSTFDGIGRAAQVSANQASRDLNNFGKQGMMVMDTLKRRGSDAFEAFGRAAIDHSQSASQIMKGFFLNSLADIAQAQGQLYLAMGFVDPTKLAAGAALLALSGALRAMAGQAGASGGMGDYSGGGAGVGSSYSSPAQEPDQKSEQKKAVTVQVQGHYFETEQTKTKLMDMIREATDATDFKYVQIGQT